MEAVAAVGLASNVLQFFEFTTKLVRISNELRNDAASSENQDHQVIATHLEGLAQGIKDSAQAISQTSATASPEEKALQAVVERCSGLSKDLLDRLKKCGIQPGQNASRLRRTRVAFKAIWNKKEIEGISNRLQLLRSDIILHYTVQIKKTQLDQQTRQSTTDDIQAIQSSIDALGQLIDGLKHDIEGAANNRRSEIINSITETRTENSQLHAQASQQTLANRLVLSEKLDGIHSSMTAMNITLENIQSRQSESFESISQVKVENSAFLASVTQQVPLGSDSSASFQNVIRPLFEEYIEKALAEMKKEYRITARSEADHLLNDLLPTLHEMQSFCTVTQGNPIGITDEDTTEAYHESSKSQVHLGEIRNAEPLAPHQLDKTNVSVIYRNRWRRKTGLGVFSVIMRDRVHFDPSGRVTKLYELTAQFNPSPRWFATGCSITYKYKSDARGSPEFGLKPKSYRVLEDGHVAFKAIMSGDISTLQSMLAQRFISPSDTNKNGQSLLSMAVLNGELDICKALVQSGADINAYDIFGFSILEDAIQPFYLCMNRQGRDIVHYLLGLPGISREPLWDNSNLVSFLAKCIIDNQITLPKIQEWASVCRFVEVDFNISDCDSFLTRVIYCLSDVNLEYFVTNNRTVRFDTLIQQKIGCDQSADTASLIPVAYAAFRMTKHFQLNPLDGNTLSPTSYVQYRGYYAAPNTAECVDFLEHVISRGITERPDCIFDTYRDVTVSDWFYHTPWQHIWEEILEEHGFDVRWVYDEDERRKRVITGETSAHEVSVGTDASATQSTRRRRGYENSGD